MGVPSHYEAQRCAELLSARFVSLVADLKAINAAGGSDRAKNVVEIALLGGKLLETSSFIFQMIMGVYDTSTTLMPSHPTSTSSPPTHPPACRS